MKVYIVISEQYATPLGDQEGRDAYIDHWKIIDCFADPKMAKMCAGKHHSRRVVTKTVKAAKGKKK